MGAGAQSVGDRSGGGFAGGVVSDESTLLSGATRTHSWILSEVESKPAPLKPKGAAPSLQSLLGGGFDLRQERVEGFAAVVVAVRDDGCDFARVVNVGERVGA